MAERKTRLTRKAAHAGGWVVAKRIAKSIPYVGTAMAIGLVGYDIKKKGVVYGSLNAGLDAIPLVGTAKNVIEFFSGDLFPDKSRQLKNEITIEFARSSNLPRSLVRHRKRQPSARFTIQRRK